MSHHVICNVCVSGAVKMQFLCGSVFYAPYINFHSFIHILSGDLDLHHYRQFKIKTKCIFLIKKLYFIENINLFRKVEDDIRTNLFKQHTFNKSALKYLSPISIRSEQKSKNMPQTTTTTTTTTNNTNTNTNTKI